MDRQLRDPLRALVDVQLRISGELAEWRVHGGPGPTPIDGMRALWRAAAERQMSLTDQPEAQARSAVGAVVNQLTNLQHEAGWFRVDAGLRERAINETLLFWTDLNRDVASSPAQHAWQRLQGIRPTPPDVSYAQVVDRGIAVQDWTDLWNTWASERSAPES